MKKNALFAKGVARGFAKKIHDGALPAFGLGLLSLCLFAAEPGQGTGKPELGQRTFASPDDAVEALRTASAARDQGALRLIFGPSYSQLMTGDPVLDAEHTRRFAAQLAIGVKMENEGENKVVLEIGTNTWPIPIPLVRADAKWFFDTAAGKEEIINRHIGKDELHAIGVCRAYVAAQREYANMNPATNGAARYARKFKSTPGKRDGLFWKPAGGEASSPFGPMVAEAEAEGYRRAEGAAPKPFHGYVFRILTRQGGAALGGAMDYMQTGDLSGGYALVAYPVSWDHAGIMTFIINQDGKLFQRNLGKSTVKIAAAMLEYSPDENWTLVPDEGMPKSDLEN